MGRPNHNSVTLAASGAGKSYLAKLEILRSLYQGTECWVIDPEDEYARLAAATGGTYIRLGGAALRCRACLALLDHRTTSGAPA